jgi:hypothetical protein
LQAEHHDQCDYTHGPDIAAPHHHQRPFGCPSRSESIDGVGQPVQVQGAAAESQPTDHQQPDRQARQPSSAAEPAQHCDSTGQRQDGERSDDHGAGRHAAADLTDRTRRHDRQRS